MDATGAAVALLLSLLWGANPVAIKLGLLDTPPLRLAVMRFVVGGAVVVLWGWLTGRLAGMRVAADEWRPLVTIGVLLGAQVSLLNIGTSLTSAAHAAVLLNMYAVHTVVLAHFMIPGDRLIVRKLAGTLVAYGGVVLLFVRGAADTSVTLGGDVLMLVSGALLGLRTVYLARAVQRLEPVKMLLAQSLVGVAIFAAGTLAFETRPTTWTPRLAGAVAYQGVLIAGFNFTMNLWLLQHYRPSALAALFLTQPIFGVVAAAVFTGDPLTLEVVVASVAVAVGIGLTAR